MVYCHCAFACKSDMHSGQFILCFCLNADKMHRLCFIIDICMRGNIRPAIGTVMIRRVLVLLLCFFRRVLKAYQSLVFCRGGIEGKTKLDCSRRREYLLRLYALYFFAVYHQGLAGLFDIDHAVENNFFSDVFLHTAVGHMVRERNPSPAVSVVISIFIDQFGFQSRL